jgi:hypothetical protein
MDGMDLMDGMDSEGEALHRHAGGLTEVRLLFSSSTRLLLSLRAQPGAGTSHAECSLRSADGHMDGMDRMDGMDSDGEALHRHAGGVTEVRLLFSSSTRLLLSLRAQPGAGRRSAALRAKGLTEVRLLFPSSPRRLLSPRAQRLSSSSCPWARTCAPGDRRARRGDRGSAARSSGAWLVHGHQAPRAVDSAPRRP